ncbi:hypothetical protein LOD99_9993 [Oopsacas minuta]|uniref:Uncharacterized protein n=1 Tax=Oopsacas minuta TaxID=111878 RepID=A0AAV7KK59_9METZ|nr:hypothetical protein LOD99_9993 [Oopsacas minuta]
MQPLSTNMFDADNDIITEIDSERPHSKSICVTTPVELSNSKFTHPQSDLDFLSNLNKDQLIMLLEDMCNDKNIRKDCIRAHKRLFPENSTILLPKEKKSKKKKKK